MSELKFAFRQLLKYRGFTTVAVLTLAIGIGANTSLFTALDTVMFRPLRVREADRLVFVASGREETFSFPFYERLRDGISSFDGCAAVQYRAGHRDLSASDTNGETEQISAQAVTGSFFNVLGVPPLLGRTLVAEDDRNGGAQPVAVISHALWRRRFASDPAIIGRAVRLDNLPLTIVGVMPPGFVGFQADVMPDLWWPLQLITQLEERDRHPLSEGVTWLVLFGRLRAGLTRGQAQKEVSVLFRRQLQDEVVKNPNRPAAERERILRQTLVLHPGRAGFVGARSEFRQPLVVLMAAVGVVLLIASANIAGLLLARNSARQREFAVRAALGAGRCRIVRQLVTESLLLAVMGGTGGLVLARWGTQFLANYLAQSGTPVPIAPDARALLFTVVTSFGTAMIFGLAPAWRLSRLDLATAKDQGGSLGGLPRGHLQSLLVVAQVALSVFLLADATLFVRTLRNLRSLDFGFQRDNLITLSVDPGRGRRPPQEMESLLRRVLEELEAVPGIRSVSVGGAGLLTGNGIIMDISVEGYSPAPGEEMRTSAVLAGPRFFETLRVPLLRGREFTPADEPPLAINPGQEHATVAILGEAMARRFFGDSDPVGRHFTVDSDPKVRLEIVGVAKDTMYSRNLRNQLPLEFYVPFFRSGIRMPPTFYLQANRDTAGFRRDIHRMLARIDPQLRIRELRPMNEVIDHLLLRERIVAQLVGFFSAFALLLSSLGLYGILAFRVAQRTREIGIRMALGARLRSVIALVIRQGLTLAFSGSLLGICAALGSSRLVASLLYGVTPTDPITFVSVIALFAAAMLACWLPARRAASIDPMEALRYE